MNFLSYPVFHTQMNKSDKFLDMKLMVNCQFSCVCGCVLQLMPIMYKTAYVPTPLAMVLVKIKSWSESVSCLVVSDSVILWTVAHQAPLSMGFFRWEYWSWLPFPCSEDLPDPGVERTSPALARGFFTSGPSGKLGHMPYQLFKQSFMWRIVNLVQSCEEEI